MKFTVIENTDVRVSRLSFGTASLHHLFSARQRQCLLTAAADVGICHFDTSPYYGYGLAESDLGRFMRGRRSAFTVTTKVGLYPWGGAAHGSWDVWMKKALGKFHAPYSLPAVDWNIRRARASLDASLKRLGTDYVDFLFLHEPDIAMVNADEFLHWLDTERSMGKVRHWGLAGLPAFLEPWLRINHPLARVLQTKDDLVNRAADFVLEQGRNLQFTYGYLSSRSNVSMGDTVADKLQKALMRNTHGSILISTRRAERLQPLARLVQ